MATLVSLERVTAASLSEILLASQQEHPTPATSKIAVIDVRDDGTHSLPPLHSFAA